VSKVNSADAMSRNSQSRQLEKEQPRTRKTVVIFCMAFFLCLLVFPLSSLFAAVDAIPEPNAGEIDLLNTFAEFDRMYVQRQAGYALTGKKWENMGNKLSEDSIKLMMQYNIGINFLLRATLIAGECYLFASQEYFRENKHEFLNLYEKGIKTLEKVIVDAERLSASYNKTEAEIIYLPSYSHDVEVKKYQDEYYAHFNPFAGRETIGTGFEEHATIRGRKVTYDIKPYANISEFLDDLKKDLAARYRVKQISTTQTARTFLSHFCPWGVQIYFLLQQAGLTNELDFQILRPFSGYTPTLGEKFIEGLKQFPDAVMGRPVASQDKIPPVISELVLRPPQTPKHIYDEMNLIIGDRKEGYLSILKKRPIRWEWVEKEPTYTIWYISPTVFDWQPSDYLWLWFTAVKFSFNPAGAVVDEVLSGLVNTIRYISGKEHPTYITAKVFVEANDKGFLTTDYIEKGEWLSAAAVTRKIASFTFNAAEDLMRKYLYEGIDPRKFNLGKTYNGGPIPPIIIRSDVSGFEQVPDDEYPRTLQAVRFFLISPEKIVYKGPYQTYDLSDKSLVSISAKEYLAEQKSFRMDGGAPEHMRKLAWGKLPHPLRSFEIITDFSPKKQVIKIPLSADTAQALSETEGVRAQLWSSNLQKPELCINMPIKGNQRIFSMELYNKNVPESKIEYGRKAPAYPPPADLSSGPPDPAELQDYYKARDSYLRDKNHCLFNIKNQYILKFVQNDKVIDEFPVIFDRGRKNQRKITGEISSPEPGIVVLDYAPPIKINKLEVKKGRIVPGKQSGE